MQSLILKLNSCIYIYIHQAFPRESGMTDDVSQAILKMSEEGELQRIQDSWFIKSIECEEDTLSAGNSVQSTQLGISSFWGLFLISAGASSVCALLHLISLLKKYRTYQQHKGGTSINETTLCFLQHLKQFIVFADMAGDKQIKILKEEEEEQSTCSVTRGQPCPHCSCCYCNSKGEGVGTSSSSSSSS